MSARPGVPRVIVLVDDAEDVHMLVNRAFRRLTRADLQLVSARNGLEALELLQTLQDRVALVLSDVHMPRMDGETLLRAARARGYSGHFLLTGSLPEASPDPPDATFVSKDELLVRLPELLSRVPVEP
jgi:CheY-like chemotaxis protein